MKPLYDTPDDFEAEIRIMRENEGGRISPPYNGIRWDFAYDGDIIKETGIYMIWPDFINEKGNSLPTDKALSIDKILKARMIIISDEMREKIHRDRIVEGLHFFCHEGSRRVAEGIVTKITGLHLERKKIKHRT